MRWFDAYAHASAPLSLAYIWRLGENHDAGAGPELAGLLKHGVGARVRMAAALALGDLGDSSAIPALQSADKDPDVYVRQQARMAIDQINMANALKTGGAPTGV